MQRDPLVDPPEYLRWAPSADGLARWDAVLAAHPGRMSRVAALAPGVRLQLHAGLLRARLADQQLHRWVLQGRLAKAWLATGEEACTIGPVHALDRTRDHCLPVIRNQAALAECGVPLRELFGTALGSTAARTAGRDLHPGDPARRCWPPVSQMGAMLPVAVGIAMAEQRRKSGAVVLAWLGDGAASTGVAHEALNLAGVRGVPLVVIVQNNGIALGTLGASQRAAPDFRGWPAMYGLHDGGQCDGNNVLDCWAATAEAVEHARSGAGPVLVEAVTFRFGGHATHDADDARAIVPDDAWRTWGARDPIGCYEQWLTERGGMQASDLAAQEAAMRAEVAREADAALARMQHDLVTALRGVHHETGDMRRLANIRAPGRDQ